MSLVPPLHIALVGAGPLGINIYKYASLRSDVMITQIVDINPLLEGKDMGEHAGLESSGVKISTKLNQDMPADVAVLATVSDLEGITPQILALLESGLPVVSTCEELFYPWHEHPEVANSIDAMAINKNVAVIGTGVNPGFLMDALPAMLTGVCNHVDRIEVRRYQDAQFRRIPFQKKIGAGLSLDQFEEKKNDGSLRHVGLSESMHFIARQLKWVIEKTEDRIEPVIAHKAFQNEVLHVLPGYASGVRQTGTAWVNGEEKIKLSFQATVGEPESYDEIEIFGMPHIRSRIMSGVHGDVATCAIILNACRSILHAAPGLRSMADIPMITSSGT